MTILLGFAAWTLPWWPLCLLTEPCSWIDILHHIVWLFALSTGSTCSYGFSLVSVNEMYFSWIVSECHRPDVMSLTYPCQRLFAKLQTYQVHLSASLKLAFRATVVYWSPLFKSRSQGSCVHLKAFRSLLSLLLLVDGSLSNSRVYKWASSTG